LSGEGRQIIGWKPGLIKEIARILKPGGIVIISIPYRYSGSNVGNVYHHYEPRFTKKLEQNFVTVSSAGGGAAPEQARPKAELIK